MTRRFFGFLGALAGLALVTGSCVDDPLADLDANTTTILTSHSSVQLTQGGGGIAITATPVDGRFTPLAVPVTAAGCDAAVTATVDTSYHPVPVTSARFIVRGVGAAGSCVNFTAGGVTKAVTAVVLPTSFSGTVTPTTPQAGDTVTISSTAQLKFDTAFVAVTFAGAAAGPILSKTADQLRVLVPFSDPGPLTIAGINVTYVPNLRVALPTSTAVTPAGGNRWAAASSWQTAPDITGLLPAAAGATSRMIVTRGASNQTVCNEFTVPAQFGGPSSGPCMMFRFTVAAPTSLNFTSDWEGTAGDPDVDVYVCADTVVADFGTANDPCFVDGGSGATGAKPQTTGNDVYAAGTYWLVLEIFAGSGPRNAYLTITRQ